MDKDLAAIQEVRDLLQRAHVAQQKYAQYSQEQVDKICAAVADAGVHHAKTLADLAVEETGFGTRDGKKLKNIFASKDTWESIRDLKTVGYISEDTEKGIYEIASPVGIVASIIPVTNPTSTALFKALICLKGRNTSVFSPHPRASRCVSETVRICNEAAMNAGAPNDVLTCLNAPSLEATQELMSHKQTSVILATGGPDLVKAAYSSGKPAFGVGPGNVPAYIDRSANIAHAVKCIISSQTFDNGTICSSEQAVVVDSPIYSDVVSTFKEQGAYFVSSDEKLRLAAIVAPNSRLNPAVVGLYPYQIADMAGFTVPKDTKVILAEINGVGREYPLSIEKLCPVLAFYKVDDWREGCHLSKEILSLNGMGHTQGVHAETEAVIREFGLQKPASRIVVNAPTAQGGVGFATNLMPSMTLGCGTMGNNITSDNITAMHLINVKRIAYIKEGYFENMERVLKQNSGIQAYQNSVEVRAKQENERVEVRDDIRILLPEEL